jgi:hypothetical protein
MSNVELKHEVMSETLSNVFHVVNDARFIAYLCIMGKLVEYVDYLNRGGKSKREFLNEVGL